MKRLDSQDQFDRREILQSAGMLALGAAALMTPGAALASGVLKPGSKPWRGLFPIGQTPFTADDKLDLELPGRRNRISATVVAYPVFSGRRAPADGRPFPRKSEWMGPRPFCPPAREERPRWLLVFSRWMAMSKLPFAMPNTLPSMAQTHSSPCLPASTTAKPR